MPGFDKSGPRGEGPMTGGGFGKCGASSQTASNRRSGSYGVGRGGRPRGGGRGRCFGGAGRNFSAAGQDNNQQLLDEIDALRDQLEMLKEQLEEKK